MEVKYDGKNLKINIGSQTYLLDDYKCEDLKSEMHGEFHRLTLIFTANTTVNDIKLINPTDGQEKIVENNKQNSLEPLESASF